MNICKSIKLSLAILVGWFAGISGSLSAEVDFTCVIPAEIEADSELHFYYKCTAKNISATAVKVLRKTDTYEVAAGEEIRLKCYDVTNHVTLEPGQKHSWWQHASARHAGKTELRIRLIDYPESKTKTFETRLRRSEHTPDVFYRSRALQANWLKFPTVTPHVEINSLGQFHELTFTNDPVLIAGRLYSGFTFVVPRGDARDLVWAFKEPKYKEEYYILPMSGQMNGFTHFETGAVLKDHPLVGPVGTGVVYQSLPAENLIPGNQYMIWFFRKHGNVESLVLSLNFPPRGKDSIEEVFKSIR